MKHIILLVFGLLSFSLLSQEVDTPVEPADKVVNEDSLNVDGEDGTEEPKTKVVETKPSVAFVPKRALEQFNQREKVSTIDAKVEKLYRQAHLHQKEGDDELAMQTYYKIINKDPKHEKARISLAQILAMKGDYSTIISVLMPATEYKDSHWSTWYWLGVATMKQGNYELSIQATEEALSRNLSNVDLWLLRALIEQETSDHNSALQLLSAAEHLAPNNPNIILNKAISNEAIGQTNLAVLNYTKYLDLVKGTTNKPVPNSVILDRITNLISANY